MNTKNKLKYAKIDSSNFQNGFQVFTSKSKNGMFIGTSSKFKTEKEAVDYCKENGYKIVK